MIIIMFTATHHIFHSEFHEFIRLIQGTVCQTIDNKQNFMYDTHTHMH